MTFLCKEKKFIFVHLYKNAGSSIKYSLRQRVKNNLELIPSFGNDKFYSLTTTLFRNLASNKIYFPSSKLQYKYYKHHTHLKFKTLEKFIFNINEYKTFAIVRNPFSWQVSQYKFMISNPNLPEYKIIKTMNFKEYINWRCLSENKKSQTAFLLSKDNKIKISKIIKIEELENQWSGILRWLGISDVKLGFRNITKNDNDEYKKYYDEETADLLIKNFKDDFTNFNYDFSIY